MQRTAKEVEVELDQLLMENAETLKLFRILTADVSQVK
jgi:hypothetical protein